MVVSVDRFCKHFPSILWLLLFLISSCFKVQIFVADLNDNPPRFDSIIYEARIPEDTEIGKEVLAVKAMDLDSRNN